MTTFAFCSNMAQRFERFVALRRLSGTDYQSQTRLLVYFDNFLAKEHFNEPCLNREIVQRYLHTLSHLHPRTRYNRFSVISQFCRYLSRFEPFCYTPEPIVSAKSETSRIPYIFTKTQILSTVYQAFCVLLKKCGIHKSKGHGPRIHDLRHTFAVHRLLKWCAISI